MNTYAGFQPPPPLLSCAPEEGPIYLDYNATTPIDPQVAAAMLPYLCKHWGNPSSGHIFGQAAKRGVDHARKQVARAIGASTTESILFTSGGTESANHAIKGAVERKQATLAALTTSSSSSSSTPLGHTTFSWGTTTTATVTPHVITSITEHPCVLEVCRHLESKKVITLTVLTVDDIGRVNQDDVARAVRYETCLVSIMHANNETGVVQDIAGIGRSARRAAAALGNDDLLIHTDASQSVGKSVLDDYYF